MILELNWLSWKICKDEQANDPLLYYKLTQEPKLLWFQRSNVQFACADPKSFIRGGPTLTTFFLVEGIMPLKVGHHRPASDNGPPLNAGLVIL